MPDISLKIKPSLKSRRYTKSSSFIMALILTILCGGAALSLGYFINYFATGHFIHSTEAVLDAEIRYIESVGASHAQPQSAEQLYIALDAEGRAAGMPSFSRLAEGILVFDYPENGRKYAAKIHTFEDNQKILIGTDITTISKDFKFMKILGIASIFFVMMVVFVAYIISVFVVSGTNKIADTAQEIMNTGDLSRRLDIGSRWDDLGNMAAVLNMLLDRVEELMQGVRQVSDNIAHDLRTPLTRMRGKIEGLDDGRRRDDLLEETDRLLNTFNALLRISRIESEKQRSQFTGVNLKILLEDVIDFYAPLAEDKMIALTSDLSEAHIHGDRNLLFQAFANLLDNAIKFTPAHGKVTVKLGHKDGRIHISISDSGSGISADEQEKIFNRFYRGEKSRNSAGTGLGLSLVHAVIHLHSGDIQVQDANPGLTIITIF